MDACPQCGYSESLTHTVALTVSEEVWQTIQALAARKGVTVGELLRDALAKLVYVQREVVESDARLLVARRKWWGWQYREVLLP